MKTIGNVSLTLLAAFLLASCNMQSVKEETSDTNEKKTQPVRVMKLEYRTTAVQQNSTATITAFEETYLSPALQGRIRSVKVEVNDHVQKGDLLAEMDRTQLDQTRLQYETLKTDLTRMDTLLKHGSVTQQSYDQMKSQVETTYLVLKNLEENTLLRAPHAGVITGKYYNDGELFSPTPNTPAGKAALVSMIQLDPVKAMVNLSEKYLPLVSVGMKADITTEVYPGVVFIGQVFRIHPTVNAATRTFTVEVRIPNRSEKLHPGMFARVSLKLGEKEALIVPSIAVLKQSGTNERYVMLLQNGQAQRVNVTILNRYNDQFEIGSPNIHGGEQLIYSGHIHLESGDPVIVVSE